MVHRNLSFSASMPSKAVLILIVGMILAVANYLGNYVQLTSTDSAVLGIIAVIFTAVMTYLERG